MAENEEKVVTQQQQNVQSATSCTGDCRRCFPMQRAYCASQLSLNNMRVLDNVMRELLFMKENLALLDAGVKNLGEKVNAITNSEGILISPNGQVQESSAGTLFAEES